MVEDWRGLERIGEVLTRLDVIGQDSTGLLKMELMCYVKNWHKSSGICYVKLTIRQEVSGD